MASIKVDKGVLLSEILHIREDYKATVVASELIEHGFPREDLYFRNVSLFRRFISKDINNIVWEENDNEPDKLVIELNREGLYDMLPDGITHAKTQKTSEQNYANEFAIHRKQEENARTFFGTFENEFLHFSLQLEIIERELYNNKNHETTRAFFEYFYGDSSVLTDIQVLTLLYILPLSNKIRADIKLISQTLTKILNYKIVVTAQKNRPQLLSRGASSAKLNQAILGVDSVISDSCLVHTFSYNLTIYNIHFDRYEDFEKNGKCSNVLDFVLPYFFPVGADVNITLLPDDSCRDFKTSIPEESNFLGFNSYI